MYPAAVHDRAAEADAQPSGCGENIRPKHRGMPGDRGTPIVTDDDGLFFPGRCDQCDHVADVVEDAVGADFSGCAGPAETTHIRRHYMKTGCGDCRDLMPPGIGQFRPAVTEQDERTVSLFQNEYFDAIC